VGRTWVEGCREWASKKVTKVLRKFYNEQLHDVCSLKNIIQVIKSRNFKLVGRVACMKRIAQRIFMGKCEGNNEVPGKPRPGLKDNVKTDVKEIRFRLVQIREQWRTLVSTVMKLRLS
jgi:hypothetical protein